jgi:LPS export ABC transporter permease LptF/LPS export ABC transporter permease LptG
MGRLNRAILRELFSNAFLGTVLFTFVLFLQRAGRSFELLVRSSATPGTVASLFGLILPLTLIFALPTGALVGILITLSRMSSDGEIVGMRAAGLPSRRILYPVLVVGTFFTLITAACSLWLTPWSIRQTEKLLRRLAAEELTAEVQARVFEEQFPNTVLYVGDSIPGRTQIWRNVFIADLRPPSDRPSSGQEDDTGPNITVAREVIAAPDVRNNRIQLHLIDASTHQATKDPNVYVSTSFPSGDEVLEAAHPPDIHAVRPVSEMDTGPVFKAARKSRDAAIELHRRFALPFACVLLAMVGISLGASSRKSGKSAAFVVTVFLAFLYYMGLISLISMAQQGTLPPAPAVWLPNALFAVAGIVMLARMERPGDRNVVDTVRSFFAVAWSRVRKGVSRPESAGGRGMGRLILLPQILDTYILTSFLFYFALLLASFVFMTHVYTFFELLGDMFKNHVAMSKMLTYLFFLTPELIYESAPLSVLVGVLVTFGIMAKHNEVIAFKATGVSLYRLAAPVLMASLLLSAGLFAMDYSSILPEANRRQDALRDEIKGRAPRTYLRPDRKWIIAGQGSRIYYYEYFDTRATAMDGVSVYEFDTHPFQLKRHISARRARWEPATGAWIFVNGWSREMKSRVESVGQTFQAAAFPELTEPPAYFLKEAIQDKQMNSTQLGAYIHELRQSGFDTVHLRVQLAKKFSVPLFAFIMALISVPFAFLTGSRGAMAGVGVSLGLAVAYWSLGQLFEQLGNVNQLPPEIAAWAPDALFAVAALYLTTRLRT